jgi:hypothetical protein
LGGFVDFTFREQAEEARDIHADRAAVNTAGVFALQAALGFEQRQLFRKAEVHLVKIPFARGAFLLRHLLALDGEPLFGG